MVYLPQVFQFTPLREGRPAGLFDATRRPYFNSRPSARGDDGLHTLFERLPDFNSRPSARGDIAALVAFRHVEDFNSRPSARGDAFSRRGATYSQFQFTPLREGRPLSRRFLLSEENFNSRPSARGDEREPADDGAGNYFNSRPSARGDGLVG